MTRKTIKEIIETYLDNDVPDQVRDSFETWMLDSDDYQEKHGALEEIWDSIPERHVCGLPPAESVLETAVKKENAGRRPRRMLWLTSAAAVLFAFISVFQFFSGRTSETCLASSEGAKGYFELPDGSKVWLNRGSRLYYSGGLEGRTRKVRLEGEGFFDISEDAAHPFVVEAYGMDVTVLGTEFTVSAYNPDRITAYLQEGSIRASGPGLEDGVVLKPDQSITFDRGASRYYRSQIKSINHTAWIGERLVFSNTSVADICETLCHWYNVDITCDDAAFASATKLSFTVRQEPLPEILGAIGHLARVTYTVDGAGNITITPLFN
ncbi:MAG: FecR domain-containing protein [Bacteroidales bacterium]|nr:FecR domain-containing protein [Bacteroides sp.]MCM1502655.1 FecR domain-containing protein [Bacteroidales bacterium]